MFNHTSMLLYNRMERHVKQRQSLLDITDAGMLITTVLLQYKRYCMAYLPHHRFKCLNTAHASFRFILLSPPDLITITTIYCVDLKK